MATCSLCHSQTLSPCWNYRAGLWVSTSCFQPWPLEDDFHWHLRDAAVPSPCSSHQPPWGFQLACGFLTYIANPSQHEDGALLPRFWSLTPLQTVVQFNSDTNDSESCRPHCLRAKSSTELCSYEASTSPVFGLLRGSTLVVNFVWGSEVHSGCIFGRMTQRTQASAIPMITVFL